ncbi:amidohydrolase [Pimelobacter simplex]|uniref:amidohydrolase n=1 Tax=Nocardioides simplex TaxID=2045 RepID=UPI003AACCA30
MPAHRAAPVTVVRADTVHPLDGTAPEAFAVLGETVVATGGWDDLHARFPGAEAVDLGAVTVVPGLNDAHAHPSLLADGGRYVDLGPATTPTSDDVRAALAARAATTLPGGWVVGHNYDPALTTGAPVDRDLLDSVSTEHPVLVIHYSYHTAAAGSLALSAAGYHDGDPDPAGGELGRDGAGRLDGVLQERAWAEGYLGHGGRAPLVPLPGPGDRIDSLARMLTRMNAAGLTSVCDAMVHPADWRLYQEAHAAGRLTARVGMLLWYEFFEHAAELGLGSGLGDPWLRFSGVKMMTDGASSGGTCLCSTAGGDRGIQVMADDEIAAAVETVHRAGSTLAVHANGDLAIGKVLDAIEDVRRRYPRTLRHRIEHCTMTDPATAARLRAADVVPVPFGAFPHHHGARFVEHYGPEVAADMCPHRTFLDAGIPVPGSSDYPCGPLEPLLALQSMTTRRVQDGTVLGADQRVTALEALTAYTVGSAYASGEEAVKGRLTPGQLADFVVLDADPLATDPEDLAAIAVRSTWVGGRRVWSAEEER